MAHHLQDLYPTYLQTSKNISAHNATIATIIGNCVCAAISAHYLHDVDHIYCRVPLRMFTCWRGADYQLTIRIAGVPLPDGSANILAVGWRLCTSPNHTIFACFPYSSTTYQHLCLLDWRLVALLHQINLPRSERLFPFSIHSSLDPSDQFQWSCSWRLLHAIRCPGCLGSRKSIRHYSVIYVLWNWFTWFLDSHPFSRDVSPCFPCHVPGCGLSTRKRALTSLRTLESNLQIVTDGIISIGADWNRSAAIFDMKSSLLLIPFLY
jgi:hypothetical protein